MGHYFAEYASFAKDHHRHQQVPTDPDLDIDLSRHLFVLMLRQDRNEAPHDQDFESR